MTLPMRSKADMKPEALDCEDDESRIADRDGLTRAVLKTGGIDFSILKLS